MAKPINMPQIGQDLETGRIIEWQVKEGDKVKKGDIVATVESDKATFEVESPEAGTILKLLFSPGDEAQVFKPIAYIGSQGETHVADKEVNAVKKPEESLIDKTRESAREEVVTSVSVSNAKIIASPSARRIVSENNLKLGNITPSGPNNRIVKRDVVEYLQSNPSFQVKATPVARRVASVEGIVIDKLLGSGPGGKIRRDDVISSIRSGTSMGGEVKSIVIIPSGEDKVILFDKTRKRIAERLTYSKQTIPHYYLFADVDVTKPLEWKTRIFNEVGVKFSFNDLLIKVLAKKLKEFPLLNSYVDDEKIVLKSHVNIGVAVSVENGLLVPVIPDADMKNVTEISILSKKNADDARRGVINPAISGSFTVSNLGMFGINMFQAIINPPESAILSVGSIEKKVIPSKDGIRVASVVTLGLAVDHRAVDGAYASKFLKSLKDALELYEQ